MSFIVAFTWGLIAGYAAVLPFGLRYVLPPLGFLAGLSLGIRGRAEIDPADRLGQIVAMFAIALNGLRLAVVVFGLVLSVSALQG